MQAVCYNGSSRILDLLLKAGARIDARTVRVRDGEPQRAYRSPVQLIMRMLSVP